MTVSTSEVNGKSVNKIENIKHKDLASIPFVFKISHKESSHRELAICHPKGQLQVVDFYTRYKELMLYYCSSSPFSIRHPCKASKYIYHKDKTHYESLNENTSGIEESSREYENLRSYFVYKDYSNIYKFYESYKYHRCEKKFNALVCLDISKCFDSIYTHSLSWALLNKETVKKHLKLSNSTFPGVFDSLMQRLNYNETNGIIIGPEFSRIFAELLLQVIDKNVCATLKNKDLVHKKDYEAFRYVDDYFIFFNNAKDKEIIIDELQVELKKFKLYLNDSKSITYYKPIVTEISIAKQRVANLFESTLLYTIVKSDSGNDGEENNIAKCYINIRSKSLIIKFKTIIRESDIEYKDIMNYSLSIIERKCNNIIKAYLSVDEKNRSQKQFINSIRNILEFVFFIYSTSPKVNSTIKLSRIIRIVISFLNEKGVKIDDRHLVFKDIYDNIFFVLKKNKNSEYKQVETLYLLVTLSELGRDYWLDKVVLAEFFGLQKSKEDNYQSSFDLNYFSLTVLLFYMKDKKRYLHIRAFVEQSIIRKYKNRSAYIRSDAELILLLLDCLACPYIKKDTKKQLLEIYDIKRDDLQNAMIKNSKYWFTKWDNFNFGKELDAKRSQEVY